MPLAFDMPFEALATYTGTNPRPADFDDYWRTALAELADTPADAREEAADFTAPYADVRHLTFTGTGPQRPRVHAKLLSPAGRGPEDAPGPAVVFFHGYSGDSGDWSTYLPYVAAGFTVAALDVRGQAGLSEDRGAYGGWTLHSHVVRGLDDALAGHPERLFYRDVFLDCARLVQLVMGRDGVDESRVATTGGSQGGALSLVAAALEPRVTRTVSIFPFLSDYRRTWDLNLDREPYSEIREWFRRRDQRHLREDEVFTALGYIDIQYLAPRITAAVTMAVGLEDEVCPPSTQFAAYNRIAGSTDLWIYPDFGHENMPGVADATFTTLVDDV